MFDRRWRTKLRWRNWRLRQKLLFSLIGLGIIPVVVIGAFSYGKSQEAILRNSKKYTMELLGQINRNLTSKIDAMNAVSLSLITNPSLKGMLNEKDEIRRGKNRLELEALLRNMTLSSPDIGDLVLVDRSGNKYWAGDGYFNPAIEFVDTPYYREAARASGNSVWLGLSDNLIKSSLYGRSEVIPSAAAIKNYTTNELLGILVLNLKRTALSGLVQDVYLHQLGNIALLDASGRLMLSAKPLPEAADLTKLPAASGADIRRLGGEDYFMTYLRNEATGWSIVSIVPKSELLASAQPIRSAIFDTSLLIILFGILFAVLISDDIVLGFNQLIARMKKVERGDLQTNIRTDRQDEVGLLSNSFDRMLQRLNDSIQTTYELHIREQQAELKALQAQIRPHFLYNTLDAINWMLIEREQYEVSEVIQALGEMLRYTIRGSESQRVPLREEVRQLANYLTIQSVRFEERLSWSIDIDAGLSELPIPKLLLQPIVENAVVHGIESRTEGGIVRIRGERYGSLARIVVEDNGQGIPADRLAALLRDDGPATGGSIGLLNVERRLKLAYGEEAGLEVESEPGSGTRVAIRLPERREQV